MRRNIITNFGEIIFYQIEGTRKHHLQNINTPIKSHKANTILLFFWHITKHTEIPYSVSPMYRPGGHKNERIGGPRQSNTRQQSARSSDNSQGHSQLSSGSESHLNGNERRNNGNEQRNKKQYSTLLAPRDSYNQKMILLSNFFSPKRTFWSSRIVVSTIVIKL